MLKALCVSSQVPVGLTVPPASRRNLQGLIGPKAQAPLPWQVVEDPQELEEEVAEMIPEGPLLLQRRKGGERQVSRGSRKGAASPSLSREHIPQPPGQAATQAVAPPLCPALYPQAIYRR